MSWAILGQIPSGLALAGGVVCLAGVALSRRRPGTSHLPSLREPESHSPSGSQSQNT
jgi:drug/metabolite transporter (DMT)-like permease